MEELARRAVPKSGTEWWMLGAFLMLIFFILLADLGLRWFDSRRFLQNGLPANALLVNKYREVNGSSDSSPYRIDVGYYDYSQTEAAAAVDRMFTAPGYVVPTIEEGAYVKTTIRINRRLYNALVYGEPLPIVFLPSDSTKARLLSELNDFPRSQSILMIGFTLVGSLVCFGLSRRAEESTTTTPYETADPARHI